MFLCWLNHSVTPQIDQQSSLNTPGGLMFIWNILNISSILNSGPQPIKILLPCMFPSAVIPVHTLNEHFHPYPVTYSQHLLHDPAWLSHLWSFPEPCLNDKYSFVQKLCSGAHQKQKTVVWRKFQKGTASSATHCRLPSWVLQLLTARRRDGVPLQSHWGTGGAWDVQYKMVATIWASSP